MKELGIKMGGQIMITKLKKVVICMYYKTSIN